MSSGKTRRRQRIERMATEGIFLALLVLILTSDRPGFWLLIYAVCLGPVALVSRLVQARRQHVPYFSTRGWR